MRRTPTTAVFLLIGAVGAIVVGRVANGGGLLGTDGLFGLNGVPAALAAIAIAGVAMVLILLALPARFTTPTADEHQQTPQGS